jgi:sucrose-phosphate synthase
MQKEVKKHSLYILLISIHGLIRGVNPELGRDADTGGQTKYVLELARALSSHEAVELVDLVTRRIMDEEVADDYANPVESIGEKARIIRIDAGPKAYLPKEELWKYLDAFTDELSAWLHRQPRLPDVLHSHYADAGYVGVRLANHTGLPLIHTGHSLGRDKVLRLLAHGLSMDEIEHRYHMSERISAEEDVLNSASLVIASTHNEIEDQYELYDCYTHEKMSVIAPGTDLNQFHPPTGLERKGEFANTLARYLKRPEKPIILALSRPDERKNIVTLLEAYGKSPRLQMLANLVIVAGNRDDIREMKEATQNVLTELLLVIDCYELYGLVAMPKHHTPSEVPDIYRLATASKGVFVNPALTEPFGLTLLEAAASGLPLVATDIGGPIDIIGNCKNGLLIDPLNEVEITDAILKILEDDELWIKFSANGMEYVAQYYSWAAHTQEYLKQITPLIHEHERSIRPAPRLVSPKAFGKTHAIFTAVDHTLLGDPDALDQFLMVIREHHRCVLFGVATGRRLDSVLKILKTHAIPTPDILITSLGTEIYYPPKLTPDIAWNHHIDHWWTPSVLKRIVDPMPGLTPQPRDQQSRFKLSYYYDRNLAPSIDEILTLLRQQEVSVHTTLSFGQFIDFVPARASKGQAIRYVSNQWKIPLERVLVNGGSGGDEDMLRGNTLGVVVATPHREELLRLSDSERVYFSQGSHAWGILEAIDHYDFFRP